MVDMLGADRTPFSVASFQVIQTEATAGFFLSRVWSYVQEAGVWANIQLSENRPFCPQWGFRVGIWPVSLETSFESQPAVSGGL